MRDKRTMQSKSLERLRQTIIGFFAANQFHQVGMRDICAKAGVSPKTVYKYFGSKQELLIACIEKDLALLSQMCDERLGDANDVREEVEALAMTQFEFYAKRKTLAKMVYLNIPASMWVDDESEAQMAFQKMLNGLLQRYHGAKGAFRNINVSVLEDIAAGGAARIIVRWLAGGARADLLEMGRQYTDVMVAIVELSRSSKR